MLKTRVVTAIIGICVAVAAISYGGAIYNLLVSVLAILGWREFIVMMKKKKIRLPYIWGYTAIVCTMLLLSFELYAATAFITVFSFLLLAVLYTFAPEKGILNEAAYGCLGFLYTVSGMAALILLRNDAVYTSMNLPYLPTSPGTHYLWLLLLSTWASDTFAYFAGRLWGKRKIVPAISPHKTLEGFIGGFIGCLITGILYAVIVGLPVGQAFMISLFVGVAAPLGDLFESKLKRDCGLKDSGVLLPGHGGVLDRFDSLLFAAPLVLVYLLV